MKKLFPALLAAGLLSACGGGETKNLAKDVCDCFQKANGMDATDPKRSIAQNDCAKKQMDAWNKVKDDAKKSEEFNKTIFDCSKDLIKNSFK
jgi:hypothetical protein